MPSLLSQLDSDAILLMYVAEELSAEDRLDVERMLARSERLRNQLAILETAYHGADDALRVADASEPLVTSVGSASRRVGQAVRNWQARRLQEDHSDGKRDQFRFPWWAYPITSAAAMVLACVAWWAWMGDAVPAGLPPTIVSTTYPADGSDAGAAADNLVLLTGPWEGNPALRDDADATLDEAEDELYALSNSRDDISSILMSETDER